jgi:anthranilate phosphoribosyltransferase
VGVYDGALVEPIARVLRDLGARCALVVHGTGGVDEISIAGETLAGEVRNGEMRMRVIRPEDFGVSASPIESVLGGGVVENAEIARRVLSGEKGPRRDIAIANAAAAIYVAGEAVSLLEGAGLAAESIDSGRAMAKLEALRAWSRRS